MGKPRSNWAEIIPQCIAKHNGWYKYIMSKQPPYINQVTRMVVTCPLHGDFDVTVANHKNGGRGCMSCGLIRRSNKKRKGWDVVIAECIRSYNGEYTYPINEQEEYKTVDNTDITAYCEQHGMFKVNVYRHKNTGLGCPDCRERKKVEYYNVKLRSSWDIVIPACIKIHGGLYEYNIDAQEEYVNANDTYIVVICEKHGDFKTSVLSHKNQATGCPLCGIESRASKRRSNWIIVIQRSIERHGGIYTYDIEKQPKYRNDKVKMVITCETHGDFEQSVNSHLSSGQGCPDCAGNKKLSWDIVIPRCIEKHDGEYNYYIDEQETYIDVFGDMVIHCDIHGQFVQVIHTHMNGGAGCPKCVSSKDVKTIKRVLDSYNILNEQEYTSPDCRGDSKILRFDFHLPDHNILIEYDGIQHFEYDPKHFHKKGYWQFEKQQRYDEIKNQYCRDNNIPLIRIRYDVENIEQYLKQELEKLGVTL